MISSKIDPKPSLVPSISQKTHLLFIDALRGFAILSVFVFHGFTQTFSSLTSTAPLTWGWIGVPVFFVISGFCIHLSHVRVKENGFREFYLRRFFRIWPPYAVALFFFGLIFLPTQVDIKTLDGTLNFLSHIFLIQNVDLHYFWGINGSFWSIAIETQLYLLYPLLLWLMLKIGWGKALLLLLLIETALNAHFFYHFFPEVLWMGPSPFHYWFSWAIGAKIADDWLEKRPILFSQKIHWIWPLIFVASCYVHKLSSFSFTFAALSTATFIAYSFSWPELAKPNRKTPLFAHLQWAGMVSYSFYLLHEPLLTFLIHWMKGLSVPLTTIFFVSLSSWPLFLGISYIYFRTIEMQSIALGRQVVKISKPRPE